MKRKRHGRERPSAPDDESRRRPWPTPKRAWAMSMRWEHLAFLHWPFSADEIQKRLPAGLRVDLHEGQAWIAVVPFRMSGVRPRWFFTVPGISRFPELNVRTYVTDGKKPGVWFFSLDAGSKLAVRGGRSLFHLPYFDARMCLEVGNDVRFESDRTHRGEKGARFRARYHGTGPASETAVGTLEHWFAERYCLYSADRSGRLWCGDVDHRPWSLAPGYLDLSVDELLEADGLPDVAGAPLVHVAEPLDVHAWTLQRVV